MSGMPRVLLPAGGAALPGSVEFTNPLRGRLVQWLRPSVELAHLSSRMLPFEVHPIGARLNAGGALYAFAYRYGSGWRVLYLGKTTDAGAVGRHKIDTAIGYGATHLLLRPLSRLAVAAEEAWLTDALRPPLNDGWR
jgi:hypothetical protein